MIFNKIEIKNFGKFKDFTLDLKSGFQTIYGANEYGKTTIMNFIKIMFYSRFCGEKAGAKDKEFRQKYSPWENSEKMSGSIEFTKDSFLYKIYKEISTESPAKDKVLLYNKSTGEKINLGKKEEVGEWLFGLDLKGFERSCFISEIGKISLENEKNSNDSLTDKIISNLTETGDESLSQSEIINRIEVAIKDLEQTRGNGGKIIKTERKISEIQHKLISLKNYDSEQINLQKELKKINLLLFEKENLKKVNELLELKKELSTLDKILNLKSENEKFTQKLAQKNLNLEKTQSLLKDLDSKQKEIEILSSQIFEKSLHLSTLKDEFPSPVFWSELKEKTENLEKIKKKLSEKTKKFLVLNTVSYFVFCITAITNYFFVSIPIIFAITAVLGAISSTLWFFKNRSKKKVLENLRKDFKAFLSTKNCENEDRYQLKCLKYENYLKLKENQEKLIQSLEILKNNFIKEISTYEKTKNYEKALEICKNLKLEFSNFFNQKQEIINVLSILDIENLPIENLKKKIIDLKEKLKYKENNEINFENSKKRFEELEKMNLEETKAKIKSQIKPTETGVFALEEDLTNQNQKLLEMKKYLDALQSAKNSIETATSEIRRNFGPNLDKRASKIFSELSNNKYKNLHIQKDFKILVENNFLTKECENFSSGTIDQAYLSLRIAISELISNVSSSPPPLFLDDALMQYDDKRLKNALNFLKNYSKENSQIILFSCHSNSCIKESPA